MKTHPIAIQARLVADIAKPIILDVGARAGTPMDKYLRSIPNCKLWAIDADLDACIDLRRMFAKDRRVAVVQAAITDYVGTAQLYLHGGGTASLLPRPKAGKVYYPAHMRTTKTVEVPATTIDVLMKGRRVDLLKMDIQGGELDALKGATEMLKTVRAVYTEAMFAPHYEGQPLYHDIAAYLEGQGFYLHALYFLSNSKEDGRLRQGDALFIKKGESNGLD